MDKDLDWILVAKDCRKCQYYEECSACRTLHKCAVKKRKQRYLYG